MFIAFDQHFHISEGSEKNGSCKGAQYCIAMYRMFFFKCSSCEENIN